MFLGAYAYHWNITHQEVETQRNQPPPTIPTIPNTISPPQSEKPHIFATFDDVEIYPPYLKENDEPPSSLKVYPDAKWIVGNTRTLKVSPHEPDLLLLSKQRARESNIPYNRSNPVSILDPRWLPKTQQQRVMLGIDSMGFCLLPVFAQYLNDEEKDTITELMQNIIQSVLPVNPGKGMYISMSYP